MDDAYRGPRAIAIHRHRRVSRRRRPSNVQQVEVMSDGMQAKVCVVTGGASGLGRATALALAQQGAIVVIGDQQHEAGRLVADEIERGGGVATYIPLDVSDSSDVRNFIGATVDRFGRLDCAINNAGIEGSKGPLGDYADDDWKRVIDINLTGVFFCMKHEIAAMLRNRSGSIVNVGSTASLRGTPLMGAYTAAKHGIVGLTKTAALECAASNIRINVICPGSFRTPMSERLNNGDFRAVEKRTPMQRVASADEIARSVVWLCMGDSTFITGAALPVDGGKLAGSL
jgi:NAD(P)-dependent dehydrogenase (short-subunit alcohol dehydrogenase family)